MQESDANESQRASDSSNPAALDTKTARARLAQCVAVFALMLCVAFIVQWTTGAYHSELGQHADESAHYVTGLMFHDYLVVHHGSVRSFIENYYAHYPRVAIGHWPPVLYGVMAVWWLVFPATIPSALVLVAVIFAALGTVTAFFVGRTSGTVLGIAAGIALLCTRLSAVLLSDVMADGLVALLVVLATLAFVKFLEGRHTVAYSAAFGVLASLAILTKGSAICLALVPVIMIVLARRWDVLLWPSLWIAPVIVAVMCGPWYWVTRGMFEGSWASMSLAQYVRMSASAYWAFLGFDLKTAGKLLALVGLLCTMATLRDRRNANVTGIAMMALFAAILIVACGIPTGVDRRLVYPAEPALIYFLVYGADRIGGWVAGRFAPLQRWRAIIAICLIVVAVVNYHVRFRKGFTGMAQPVEVLVNDSALPYPSVLVVSDAFGEGVFISEMATRRFTTESITVRGSKLLADVNWAGTDYKSMYATPGEVTAAIEAAPINFVVVDDSIPDDGSVGSRAVLPHKRLLDQAIAESPASFQLIGTYSISRGGRSAPGTLRLYRFVHQTTPPSQMTIRRSRMAQAQFEVEVPSTRRPFSLQP